MTRTTRALTAFTCLLILLPAAAADPIGDPVGFAGRCSPPPFVPLDAEVEVEFCPELEGFCTYDVIPDETDAASGGTWGAWLHLDMEPVAGYSTFVHCQALASVRSLHYGSEGLELRWADLRIGHAVDEEYVPRTPAAREAAQPYGPGMAVVLELELELDAWRMIPNALPAKGEASLSVPVGTHNTPWLPNLSPIGERGRYSIEGDLTRDLPLLSPAAH